MDYIPHTESDVQQMLETIGVSSVEELLDVVPAALKEATFNLPEGLTELEVTRRLQELAAQNRPMSQVDVYRGAGMYEHAVPTVVEALSNRGEFATAYTPYQPEASQGTLQVIYEFQTLVCELTGMDVANASLYDGASAFAEAALTAFRITGRDTLIISRTVHHEYRDVLHTYLTGTSNKLMTVGVLDGITDVSQIEQALNDRVAAVMIQMPNFFGALEPVRRLAELAHANGALLIVAIPEPASLGLLEAPGAYGADIVVGEAQTLGSSVSYGGPSLGFFATREQWLRKIPGRICGKTVDRMGRTGYVLTLQAREQHIRREKATSNICTNEGLLALRATIFLSALGPTGLQELALLNFHAAHYLYDALVKLPMFRQKFRRPFFNEFVLELADHSEEQALKRALDANNIVGGVPLDTIEPELTGCWLWCVTETKTKAQLDRLVEVLRGFRG